MRSLNAAGERCGEKQIPGLLAVSPIPEQFLLQTHSHKGSKVPTAFVLSSRVVTNKLLFLFLQWKKLQQLPVTELHIWSLPCASCSRRTVEPHLDFKLQKISDQNFYWNKNQVLLTDSISSEHITPRHIPTSEEGATHSGSQIVPRNSFWCIWIFIAIAHSFLSVTKNWHFMF